MRLTVDEKREKDLLFRVITEPNYVWAINHDDALTRLNELSAKELGHVNPNKRRDPELFDEAVS